MQLYELAQNIQKLEPNAQPRDVARLCLLLTNHIDNLEVLRNEDKLSQAWKEMGLRLHQATDQHCAMTEELESLAKTDPEKFSAEQIWILIRAIKVQSQILQLYVGMPFVDV